MTEPKPDRKPPPPKIDDLSVNKETIENLTDKEAEQVEGGLGVVGVTNNFRNTCDFRGRHC